MDRKGAGQNGERKVKSKKGKEEINGMDKNSHRMERIQQKIDKGNESGIEIKARRAKENQNKIEELTK